MAPKGPPDSSSADPVPASSVPRPRKRTKTGCLTCRQRRVKCGEEKPTCANCTRCNKQCQYERDASWLADDPATWAALACSDIDVAGAFQFDALQPAHDFLSPFTNGEAPWSEDFDVAPPLPPPPHPLGSPLTTASTPFPSCRQSSLLGSLAAAGPREFTLERAQSVSACCCEQIRRLLLDHQQQCAYPHTTSAQPSPCSTSSSSRCDREQAGYFAFQPGPPRSNFDPSECDPRYAARPGHDARSHSFDSFHHDEQAYRDQLASRIMAEARMQAEMVRRRGTHTWHPEGNF